MIELLKRVLVWIIALSVFIFLISHLITDPVGSAHAISTVFGGIKHFFESIYTFATSF